MRDRVVISSRQITGRSRQFSPPFPAIPSPALHEPLTIRNLGVKPLLTGFQACFILPPHDGVPGGGKCEIPASSAVGNNTNQRGIHWWMGLHRGRLAAVGRN